LLAAVRWRRLSVSDAIGAWESYDRIAVRFAEINVLEALRLAVERGLYAYDAYVLALSQTRRLPLLTLDHPLRRAAAAIGVARCEFCLNEALHVFGSAPAVGDGAGPGPPRRSGADPPPGRIVVHDPARPVARLAPRCSGRWNDSPAGRADAATPRTAEGFRR